jgi:Protein of unknown function (DUF1186)
MTNPTKYKDSIAQLLYLELDLKSEWLDYPAQFGLTAPDIPELQCFVLDDSMMAVSPTGDWDLHGIRAVTQMEPSTGIDLCLQILKIHPDADFVNEECIRICKRLGSIAIKPMISTLQNPECHVWNRVMASDGLGEIAKHHPEHRDICIQALISQLRCYAKLDDDFLNTILVNNLVDLKAIESADLLAEVFAAGQIDEFATGTWPQVQVELGLKLESDFSPEELNSKIPPNYQVINDKLSKLMNFMAPPTPKTNKASGFGSTQKKKANQKKKKH